jgi:hypothetical protein
MGEGMKKSRIQNSEARSQNKRPSQKSGAGINENL